MNKPTKNHISCGGILFDAKKENAYLILKKERNEWLLPKGHIKDGEDLIQTAIREVYEETGYKSIRLLDTEPVKTIEYDFELANDPNYQHHKVVHFYAFELKGGERDSDTQEEGEGLGGDWIPIDCVVDKLGHENEKDVARRAIKKFIG